MLPVGSRLPRCGYRSNTQCAGVIRTCPEGMKLRPLAQALLLAIIVGIGAPTAHAAENAVQFNTDVLDLDDRSHIDLSQFSQAGYVMPGTYTLALKVNKSSLPERPIQFMAPDNDPKGSEACLTADMVALLGLTSAARRQLTWWHNKTCLAPESLKGMTLRGDIGAGVLYVNLPQAYLEYTSDNWDPPSRWDEGIPGLLFDYSVNTQATRQAIDNGRQDNQNASGTGTNDDGMYLSLSFPFGNRGSISYGGDLNRSGTTHQVSYYDQINEHDNYQISTGVSRNGGMTSGSYSHRGDLAQVNSSVSYQGGRYSSVGLSLQGGATATLKGAALHRSGGQGQGSTRILLDTGGVPGIPLRGLGASIRSNRFGKAVVPDVSSYYRNRLSIDLDTLPDNAEATLSVVQATLTEGAIGYRHFDVIAGEKAMAIIRLADGTYPPFGATVLNKKQQEVGIVNDDGGVYMSGIQPGETMMVHWSDKAQCAIVLPLTLSAGLEADTLLPCVVVPPKVEKGAGESFAAARYL